MLNHFETLCNLCASSGDESEVRNYILSVRGNEKMLRGKSTRWAVCWYKNREKNVLRTS